MVEAEVGLVRVLSGLVLKPEGLWFWVLEGGGKGRRDGARETVAYFTKGNGETVDNLLVLVCIWLWRMERERLQDGGNAQYYRWRGTKPQCK